jgi:carbamoyl-phosphate synthase small subunit
LDALLILEDGRAFACRSFTGPGEARGEIVFNTSMTGYQEVLTDPSYRGQIVTMTYPLVGNYGTNLEDVESDRIQVAGFVVREYQDYPSNYRSRASLANYLEANHILGVDGLDTRALTRHLRNAGVMRAGISTEDLSHDSLRAKVLETPSMAGQNLATVVSTKQAYLWHNGAPLVLTKSQRPLGAETWPADDRRPRVVALDFGIKYNILRQLDTAGLQVLVVPDDTSAETIRALQPDGIFLSNGPGDPEPVNEAIATIEQLLNFRPMFGICLGHQLMGLALGGRTFKLKFGHRGANQPVKNLLNGRIEITSQNHGFGVDVSSMDYAAIELTHINLNDQTLEGFRHRKLPLLAVQYHPEASPGPHDADYLFDVFKQMILTGKPAHA